MTPARFLLLAIALALALPAVADAAKRQRYLISLGDSYATGYCEFRDIHARTVGYTLIAELIVKTLPRR